MATPPPSDLVALPDATGVGLVWNQTGTVDGWTVYCDPLDGTDTDCVFVTEPTYRFGDLAPGEHHFGVVAWYDGEPSSGDGAWIYASVEPAAAGSPTIPVITTAVYRGDDLLVSWISQDVDCWELRLTDGCGNEQRCLGKLSQQKATVVDLVPGGRYGLQVRAIARNRVASGWSEPVWVDGPRRHGRPERTGAPGLQADDDTVGR